MTVGIVLETFLFLGATARWQL